MEIIPCTCNFDIPGVEELPPHTHVYLNETRGTGRYFERGPFKGQEIQGLVNDPEKIFMWVNWKEVARALSEDLDITLRLLELPERHPVTPETFFDGD